MPASVDSNTVALWRLSDACSAGVEPSTFADETGTVPLTNHGAMIDYDGIRGTPGARFVNSWSNWGQSGALSALDAVCSGDVTFEGWFFPYSGINYETLFSLNNPSHNNPFLVGFNSLRTIYGQWVDGTNTLKSYATPTALTLLQWTHVAVRRANQGGGNNQMDIFYNGVNVGSTVIPNGVHSSTGTIAYIGASGWASPGDLLNGALVDCRFSKVARSDAEILATYQAGMPSGGTTYPKLAGVTSMAAGYRKTLQGDVVLKGRIKSGSVGSAVFTLPAGYRPSEDRVFDVHAESSTASVIGAVTVKATGDVVVSLGANALVSLDGIRFLAEQ